MSIFRWPLALSPWLRARAAAVRVAPLRPRLVASQGSLTAGVAPELPVIAAEIAAVTSPFFAWLLSQPKTDIEPSVHPTALDERALSVLARLDEVIQSELRRSALLPRAPQVLPQLMRSLRDDHYVSVEVAARIGKDAVLAAEVIRAANGSYRGSREPIVDLSQAVLSIGADHLRRVIAKSVLRPIFSVRGASLSALAAPQIWVNAEFKARLCSETAAAEGLDPLDGYLAGMLHDCGWTALLRALDGLGPQEVPTAAQLIAPAMARALADRRDLLFCKLMRPWQLSMPLVAMADEIEASSLAAAQSPLAVSLQRAHVLASMHALACDARLPDGMDATLMSLPPGVQACYLTVTRAG
jgi:HD-like signal output (HDOD) protein